VAVEAGRIVALDHEAIAWAEGSIERIDLRGKTLVPGFHDGHCHPILGGAWMTGADIWGVSELAVVLDRVGRYAREHPEQEWVKGFGYIPAILPNGYGDATLLDAVVADRPVWLTAADGHTSWVNSKALELAGIGAETPDPPHGRIVRRADGSPLGALLEAAQDVMHELSPVSAEEKRRGLPGALGRFLEKGVTWLQDAWALPEDADLYRETVTPSLPAVSLALVAQPDRWRDQQEAFAAARSETGRVRVATVKFFADGVIETATAALLDDYCDQPGRGIPNWSREELAEAVSAFDRAGFQIHIHAIGDAAIRSALDAIATANHRNGSRDRRATIAHTQLVHPDDLDRFARLDVIANFEPFWARLDPVMVDLTLPRLGPERSARQYPIGSLLRSGAEVSFGSDWPVSTLNPLEGIGVAVTRQTAEGDPEGGWLPDERIDLDAALSLYTRAGAHQGFREAEAGRIAVGLRADLVLLGADLTTIRPLEISSVPIEAVWLSGERVV
jgi:hypothetical protein